MKDIDLVVWLSQCVYTAEHYDSFISESDIGHAARNCKALDFDLSGNRCDDVRTTLLAL